MKPVRTLAQHLGHLTRIHPHLGQHPAVGAERDLLIAKHVGRDLIACVPMCGRITLTRPNFESIAAELNVAPMNHRGYPIFKSRYNVAPTDTLPILTLQEGERHISPMAWGTIPKSRRGMLINWRSESFPPRSPRCGVITDGFYEWSGPKDARQPHWFHRPDHALVVLAGMWKMQQQRDNTFA